MDLIFRGVELYILSCIDFSFGSRESLTDSADVIFLPVGGASCIETCGAAVVTHRILTGPASVTSAYSPQD